MAVVLEFKKIIHKEFIEKAIYANNNVDRDRFPGIKIMEIVTTVYTRTDAIIPFKYKDKTYYAGLEFDERFYQTEEINKRIEDKIKEIEEEVRLSSNDEYVITRQLNKKALYEEALILQMEGVDVKGFAEEQLSKSNWDKKLLHELMSINKITQHIKKGIK